ncbi:MAG: hypothetical protein DRI97_07365 [Bacteroidetes bacterium]|nr:MAG: hypothetical protein DRI97_07365 [Bacteroidota bacterium]RLD98562.1 MAG: hypothetical protein DRJ13_10790 [Bacteroidota bacterium]
MKLILLSALILVFASALMAQDTISSVQDTIKVEQVKPAEETQASKPQASQAWKNKIYFGGYVNFSLGNYAMVGIEPMVGYKLLPFLSLGLKLRYDYISDKRYSETYNTSNYGGSLFARINTKRRIYLHAEYASYNYELFDEYGELGREWIPYLFLGGGYSQPLGGRTSLNAQILFDVLLDDRSPYKKWEPFYSVGISVGF